ncbi:hypothetical protein [Sphingomonas sp.]|uniref:hypothetical protein n=1 Tax=Sphingomonas sp. TaxID=28214 RepID=UPI002B5FC4E2|nr:hypothetical protein [Sphingomonas sp.]HTG37427.1 hypothetical protein [Sphingomonas sp.]
MFALILFACATNPLVIALAVLGTVAARRAWHAAIAALLPVVVIGAVEAAPMPPLLMLGYLLGGMIWAGLAWAVKRQLLR